MFLKRENKKTQKRVINKKEFFHNEGSNDGNCENMVAAGFSLRRKRNNSNCENSVAADFSLRRKRNNSNCENSVAADFSLRKERKHRLPLNYYKGRVKITFTFCIEGKKILFADKAIVDKFLEILIEIKNKYDCKNWVYIFMPDHVHLII